MFTVKTLDEMGFKDKERSDFLATYSGSTSRARFTTGRFLIEKHQCHNYLGLYLQQNYQSYLVINDLEPCLDKCRKSLKEFILANHFADDSPWSELFEYMELFEHNGKLFYYFYFEGRNPYISRLLLNFSIALRALSEGDSDKYRCDRGTHNYGLEHYLYLMKTFDLNWKQAAVLSRVIQPDGTPKKENFSTPIWKLYPGHFLNHHFLNNVFSSKFLEGKPNKPNGFSPNGNDLALWDQEHPFADGKPSPISAKRKILFGTLKPISDNLLWTTENIVYYVKNGKLPDEHKEAA